MGEHLGPGPGGVPAGWGTAVDAPRWPPRHLDAGDHSAPSGSGRPGPISPWPGFPASSRERRTKASFSAAIVIGQGVPAAGLACWGVRSGGPGALRSGQHGTPCAGGRHALRLCQCLLRIMDLYPQTTPPAIAQPGGESQPRSLLPGSRAPGAAGACHGDGTVLSLPAVDLAP